MSIAGLHILLAEDNPTNQMVAVQMLQALGARVTLAGDGEAALELAESRRFDLALIDIEMPRLSGTDVIRRLRAGPPPQREMPLIALTAYVMGDHRAAILEAGADGMIAKPILSVEALEQDILAIVEQRPGPQIPAVASVAPSAEPASGRAASIDLRIYESLVRAIGPVAIQELLRKMDRDILGVREKIETCLEPLDRTGLRGATHILVAVAGSLGATKLQYDAQCLNSAAHSGDISNVDRLGKMVIAEIDLLRGFLRSELQG